MKKSDITDEQFREAARCSTLAVIELREEGEGRWWDTDYQQEVEELLFFGHQWRRIARIHSVEDARRELLAVAEKHAINEAKPYRSAEAA